MYFKGNAMRFSLRARLHVCVGLAFDTLTHVDQWPLEKLWLLPTDDYYISVYQCYITLERGTTCHPNRYALKKKVKLRGQLCHF